MAPNSLSPLQQSFVVIQKLKAQLAANRQARTEPIAIVGMSCRFPGGANDPDAFWQLLSRGQDAVTEIPPERWDVEAYYDPDPNAPRKMYTREAGFLQHPIDLFDAHFFGMSPREANSLDPQHRLLLEVSWEALEHAGLSLDEIAQRTGIFVGIGQNDYAHLQALSVPPEEIDVYASTGNGYSFASGRLSYILGLQGPNLALDTACSSSLVAVHLACAALRNQECDVALASGVQLMVSPEVMIALSKMRALSPDGRCKTFSAQADGYGRGEGCGVVVLKRLSDARRDGDNILALIRGSAVNHDGPSSGLTVPNGLAQEALIRQALEAAQVEPHQIAYVEAHGTGTSLGDPIEVEALNAVFGTMPNKQARETPLLIGSVKSNIGHLEAGAGIASLIKVVLALQHGEIPASLHVNELNPHIPWDKWPVKVPTSTEPWPTPGRLAGVSSFGLSGTNAHLVLEAAPPSKPIVEPRTVRQQPDLLCLSAKNEGALHELMKAYEQFMAEHPDANLSDICFTAAVGRKHHKYRHVVLASSVAEAREQLSALISTDNGSNNKQLSQHHSSELRRLGEQYIAGETINWSAFYAKRQPSHRRVPLPTYPFQRQRYWVNSGGYPNLEEFEAPKGHAVASTSEVMSLLHQGQTAKLAEEIIAANGLSAAEADLLPKLLDLLVKQHQQQLALQGTSSKEYQDWLYEVQWHASEVPELPNAAFEQAGSWLLLADLGGVAEALANLLEERGQMVQMLYASHHHWRAQLEALWQEMTFEAPLKGVIHLWGLDTPPSESLRVSEIEQRLLLGCGSLLDVVQRLAGSQQDTPRLWVFTKGAVNSDTNKNVPLSSVLWGMGKVIALEHLDLWGGAIDLAPTALSKESARIILAELSDFDAEREVIYRDGQRLVARLLRQAPPSTPFASALRLHPEESYLITGGLGALGLNVAHFLVERGVRQLILTSRRGIASPQAEEAVDQLQQRGCDVHVVKADVSKEEDVIRLLERAADVAPLRGIIHAAGVVDSHLLTDMTSDDLLPVLRPKVSGSWLLHQHTQQAELDFFVMFSSIVSVWGSVEQAHYAAANQFLDALAHHRRAMGLPALAINWGPWAGGGMATDEAQEWLSQRGVSVLESASALDALEYLLGTNAIQTTVAKVEWARFKPIMEIRGPQPLFETIEAIESQQTEQTVDHAWFLPDLEEAPPSAREALLRTHLQGEVAQVLAAPQLPAAQEGFFDMGFDSLMTVELSTRLQASLGVSLPSTLAFDFPNIDTLMQHLLYDVLALEPAVFDTPPITIEEAPTSEPETEIEELSAEELMAQLAGEFI